MSFLLITGSEHSNLSEVSGCLVAAGMSPARHGEVYVDVTFDSWHQDILASSKGGRQTIKKPGKIWEQLAVDLMLGNRHTPSWGWAGTAAIPLLDFWLEFDARIKFLLLCEGLEASVLRFITSDQELESLEAELSNWRATHESLLRFHLRNPGRSVLCWGQQAMVQRKETVQLLRDQLGITYTLGDAEPDSPGLSPDVMSVNPLLEFLVRGLCEEYPHALTLHHELSASVVPLAPINHPLETPAPEKPRRGSKGGPPHRLLIEGYRQEKARLLRQFRLGHSS